ncbi:HAMP domain-containing sensor histidine kinase [Actinophytocola sp.]|uniref:sensor histidine kinase n=1 Tax=Actinophytocola sp. TaxID=1872138 RepID=UPI002ED6A82D
MSRYVRAYRGSRLGTRLALGLAALALVVFAVVGATMVSVMRHYLERQLDVRMGDAQVELTNEFKEYGGLKRTTYGWFTVVYSVASGRAVPHAPSDLPKDADDLAEVATDVAGSDELYRTVHLRGLGTYRLRGCEVEPGVVLVSAAPVDDIDETVRELVVVEAVAFGVALFALVLVGRAVLRRGLKPLAAMAHTAHDITSQNLTDSARLPVRASGGGGGAEVEELRTAFNTMLAHIDDSLAARTEAEQRLRRFIADASHELRTPLTSIRGYADLFGYAAANTPGERDKHLARLRAEATRMSALLDDLLLLARLDADEPGTPLRLVEVDLAELAAQAAEAFRAGHPEHPLTITAEPVILRLDPLRIRQVLDNLLTNAAVHTPPGTPVSVTVRPGAVDVHDAGPGIPPADLDAIFDRFYRVDKTRSRDRGGSGLGLSVARSLVRAHGGDLTVRSEPGSTTFTVRLPAPRMS